MTALANDDKQLVSIKKSEIEHYIRSGVTVYYKWDKSEMWYDIAEETVKNAFEIIARSDYQFAIRKEDAHK